MANRTDDIKLRGRLSVCRAGKIGIILSFHAPFTTGYNNRQPFYYAGKNLETGGPWRRNGFPRLISVTKAADRLGLSTTEVELRITKAMMPQEMLSHANS